jgi:hypothetical protein
VSAPIHIIVTCTKRKTHPVDPKLMVRSLPKDTIENRGDAWIDRLSSTWGHKIPAVDLYAGDHWKVVQSLIPAAASSGYRADLWICSAGYGLISPSCKILPYSATFSPMHPDSVCKKVKGQSSRDAPSSWWQHLAAWNGPSLGKPRHLAEMAEGRRGSPIWVIASKIYLHAIAEDLKNLARNLGDPDRLSIFSAGTGSLPGLNEHLIPMDARLQTIAGGARRSLNTRLARKALLELRRSAPTHAALSRKFKRLLAQQPQLTSYGRAPMTDEEVRRFIEAAIQEEPQRAFSPLLRHLRDSGFACEHRRFATLFRQVQERINEA